MTIAECRLSLHLVSVFEERRVESTEMKKTYLIIKTDTQI
jgi:hypothetical protein